ncbi:MAG: methyl-accepting chemotaxis protein, partial [Spirochaeta sp.]|nr:methyl-accepting chemotaxis protein [Spirochaeta sp.]
ESRSDQDYLDRLAERMSDEKVLSVVPAAGTVAEEYFVEDGVMTFRGNELEMQIDVSEIDAAVRSYAWGIVGLVAIILVFLVATAFPFMHVFLVKPLRALLANLENISGAEGDLTQRLKVQSNDEIGRIAAAFNAFVERIQEVVTEMKAASESGKDIGQTLMEATQDSAHRLGEVSAAAETNGTRLESLNGEIQASAASVNEISASVENMTVVAETQAQEVADSLAAVEQMNASIANLAQIANKRREGAQTLVSTAQDANDKMSESVRSIAEMEKSTEDLLGLIDVINGIASQTNLLSMNAASP